MTIVLHSDEHFSTSHLELFLITHEELLELHSHPASDSTFSARTFSNPHGILTTENLPRENRVADVQAHPHHIKWYYRLIVLRETSEIIGSVSFHAPPDAAGMVEIGFGIHLDFRNRGFGKEALMAMFMWACEQPTVKTLRYTVASDNAPSQAIVQQFNFAHKGVQIDDEDGPEDIYEMSTEEYFSRFIAMR